ncbi:MAG: hypothetical protein EBU76_06000, partial [Gammaproteobacteria bacterium]|nr:hypothetical protein [Gammaproteobacteria bacterium]
MALTEIRVPDLGSFKEVSVIEILVQPGDTLEIDTPIATLETEKATMDVPSPIAGVLRSLHIERGDRRVYFERVARLHEDLDDRDLFERAE